MAHDEHSRYPLPRNASAVYQIIQSAIGQGLREEDFLSLYELQARTAGLPADGQEPGGW
jgi:hypothetical protein